MSDISKISPDGGQTILDIKDAEARKRVSESLLKDTVGWVGKNKFYGITGAVGASYSKTSTGYRVVLETSGTYKNVYTDFNNLKKNTDYIVSSDVDYTSGKGLIQAYGSTDGTNFTTIKATSAITTDGAVELAFNTGNYDYIRIRLYATFDASTTGDITYDNLMLCYASIKDRTYEPPHPSVEAEIEQVYADNGVLGAKNRLGLTLSRLKTLNPAGSGFTWNGNVCTRNSVTWTVITDDNDYVKKIELSGTPSANTTLELATLTGAQIKAMGASLILSGGINTNAYLLLRKSDWSNVARSNDGDSSALDTSSLTDATTYYLSAPVVSGTDTSGFVLYPMLRLATDPDSTYQPYAMTNRELTEMMSVNDVSVTFSDTSISVNTDNTKVKECGHIVSGMLDFTLGANAISGWTNFVTFAFKQYPKSSVRVLAIVRNITDGDTLSGTVLIINTLGVAQVGNGLIASKRYQISFTAIKE